MAVLRAETSSLNRSDDWPSVGECASCVPEHDRLGVSSEINSIFSDDLRAVVSHPCLQRVPLLQQSSGLEQAHVTCVDLAHVLLSIFCEYTGPTSMDIRPW
jgi:hypothetical protein